MNKNKFNISLLPYLSANFFDSPIPRIINIIPPALNRPKPAESGSSPKKLIPMFVKNSKIGLIKAVNLYSFT